MVADHIKRQVVERTQNAAARIFRATNADDPVAVQRSAQAIGTIVQAGQTTLASLVGADLGEKIGLKDLPPVDVSITQRAGVDKPAEYERPFRTAQKDGALRAAHRLNRMVVTDIQMASIRQAQKVLEAGGRQTYHRVPTSDNPCALCEIASTQTYFTGDLLPIHDGCLCDIEPGPPVDKTIDTAALEDSGDQKKLIASLVENEADTAEYQDLIAVREHGEIGDTLTWKHQSFTGPRDLPVPPSREVLELPELAGRATATVEQAAARAPEVVAASEAHAATAAKYAEAESKYAVEKAQEIVCCRHRRVQNGIRAATRRDA